MKHEYVSFRYLKFFLILVILLIIGSVVFKIISEVTQSKFKNNTFSVLYVAKDSKLIYVDKKAKEVMFLAMGDMRKYVKGKNTVGVSFALGLPIHGMIIDEKPPENLSELSSSKTEWRLIFDNKILLKGMDRYDIHKVIEVVRSAPKDNKFEARVNIFNASDLKKIEEYFIDSAINNMQYTIEIENGTTLNGLGSELALILGRVGFNVIAVRTSPSQESSFVAFSDNNNYVNSLLGFTNFDYRKEKVSQAADITIFLGDDIEAMLSP